MSDKENDRDQSYTEKFENRCFDQHARKPSDLPPSSSKHDRILVLIDCVLPIVRKRFTREEIDFMISFRSNRGDRNLTAFALDIEPDTVDYYQKTVLAKMEKLAKLLLRLLKMSR